MATLVLNELSYQPCCLSFYRNSLKKVPKQKWTLWNGYVDDGFSMVEEQREGYMRELHGCMLLHFREKPIDQWQIKHIWDYHTTPEEVYKFFGYDIHNLKNEPIYIENVNPWLCFTQDNVLVLYFGEDKPILKTKTTKIFSKHAKIWANHLIFKENKGVYEYKYWDVKDKSKLLFCGQSSIDCVFPEFDWSNIDPYGKCIRLIDLGVFRASDPYDYSEDEKQEILRKRAEEEERKRQYKEELYKRKHTPGYCCRCGCEGASYVRNPYYWDMYNESHYEWLCDRCYEDIIGDI